MSYEHLRRIGATFRPIDSWPGAQTASRQRSPFSARLSDTLELLARELRAVNARQVILQVALGEADIRLDGFPKANRTARHPGVILSFESKHGPLKFAVDRFWGWEDNLRAIALGMEALRKVDRYGVTRRGEQYTGWKALPVSTDPADSLTSAEEARALVDGYGGLTEALKATHPDRGGDPGLFRRVMKAKELLAARGPG